MKKLGVLAVVLAMAFLFVGAANAEMYLEGYIGATFSDNLQLKGTASIAGIGSISGTTDRSLSTAPSVIGGLKLGTWFVKEGTLGYDYPDWMKYFGFYTDFSYQRLDARRQVVARLPAGFVGNIEIESEGSVATWAFMFAARYGFLQDSEVPFGRLHSRDAKLSAVSASGAPLNPALINGVGMGNTGSTNIALAAEGGIRYMCLKNVSVDLSFKYRYATPSFNYDSIAGSGVSIDFKPTYNLFSGQLGVAYHF
ncbi:MAG: hypothetical protein NTW80_14335 [Deltaproteobacteria bacterium]|nr:hypothetical protein [Deltaproteobacteria bacterium]